MRLFAFLRPDLARLDHLERRVAQLEAENEARQVAFLDIAGQVKRHLQRAAAIEQRMKAADDDAQQHDATDPKQLAAVLRTKFHHNGGA